MQYLQAQLETAQARLKELAEGIKQYEAMAMQALTNTQSEL